MSSGGGMYWVCDSEKRVLGPLTLQTLAELVAASRIQAVTAVSRDGDGWVGLSAVPEVASLFTPAEPSVRQQQEIRKAEQLAAQLATLRAKPAHEILGTRPDAGLEELRTAYFALAKRFHPARLPPGTHARLRETCLETFQFLSELMERLDAELGPKPRRAPVTPAAAIAPASPSVAQMASAAPARRYEAKDFVGLAAAGGTVEATIRVNALTASIFTDHHTVNFNNESVFLPTPAHLPLGTVLNVNLIFDNSRQIRSRARVVWENVAESAKAKYGLGVRLISLDKNDKQFIREFLRSGVQGLGEPGSL